MSNANQANWYGTVFKAWDLKRWGSKPSAEMLANAHNLGCRPGKQALAIAMGMRDGGVTGSQIVGATGAPQLNKMRGLIADSYLKRLPVSPSAEGHTVYKLEVTPKGLKRVKANEAKAAETAAAGEAETAPKAKAKAKGAAKAKRTKTVKAAEPATGEADKAAEPVTVIDTTGNDTPQLHAGH